MSDRLTLEGLFCDIAMCTATPGGSFCEDGSCIQRKTWEKGCGWCEGFCPCVTGDPYCDYRFCPMCGREL